MFFRELSKGRDSPTRFKPADLIVKRNEKRICDRREPGVWSPRGSEPPFLQPALSVLPDAPSPKPPTETHVLMEENLFLTHQALGHRARALVALCGTPGGPPSCAFLPSVLRKSRWPWPVLMTKILQSLNRTEEAFEDQSCLCSVKPPSPPF